MNPSCSYSSITPFLSQEYRYPFEDIEKIYMISQQKFDEKAINYFRFHHLYFAFDCRKCPIGTRSWCTSSNPLGERSCGTHRWFVCGNKRASYRTVASQEQYLGFVKLSLQHYLYCWVPMIRTLYQRLFGRVRLVRKKRNCIPCTKSRTGYELQAAIDFIWAEHRQHDDRQWKCKSSLSSFYETQLKHLYHVVIPKLESLGKQNL